MPALDRCHAQVVRAFEKDGWSVTESPGFIHTPARSVYVDIGIERQIDGERTRNLLIEVKCFTDRDQSTHDLYTAIGQYLIYRSLLTTKRRTDRLYLAVPYRTYQTLFDRIVMRVIEEQPIKLVIEHRLGRGAY